MTLYRLETKEYGEITSSSAISLIETDAFERLIDGETYSIVKSIWLLRVAGSPTGVQSTLVLTKEPTLEDVKEAIRGWYPTEKGIDKSITLSRPKKLGAVKLVELDEDDEILEVAKNGGCIIYEVNSAALQSPATFRNHIELAAQSLWIFDLKRDWGRKINTPIDVIRACAFNLEHAEIGKAKIWPVLADLKNVYPIDSDRMRALATTYSTLSRSFLHLQKGVFHHRWGEYLQNQNRELMQELAEPQTLMDEVKFQILRDGIRILAFLENKGMQAEIVVLLRHVEFELKQVKHHKQKYAENYTSRASDLWSYEKQGTIYEIDYKNFAKLNRQQIYELIVVGKTEGTGFITLNFPEVMVWARSRLGDAFFDTCKPRVPNWA